MTPQSGSSATGEPGRRRPMLPGCLLLRFARDGRCYDLWDYWHVQPGRQDPRPGWGR